VRVPRLFREIVEEIAAEARRSEHIDQSSGVSVRLSVSALELLASNVERRMVTCGEETPLPRLCDLFALLPAITGKCELVYEGEQEGAGIVAARLVGQAVKTVFARSFPAVHRSRKDPAPPEPLYERIQAWFSGGRTLELTDRRTEREERTHLREVDGLRELVQTHLPGLPEEEETGAMEFALEALHQHSVLSREGTIGEITYGDMLSRMMQDL
jgi:magnesium chelatase subunit I